jgi:hypothetical protein
MEEQQESQSQPKPKERKRPVRAEFHFPIYPLSVALEIVEKVEMEGGGSLSNAALARSLGASAKSSGFQLKVLTAKQFGLLTKQGDNLIVTPIGKSIFKPVSDKDKATALANAFNNIRLFRAVSDRYEGSPLPLGAALKNILEREFKVPNERVTSAESMLLNSAKTAGVLQESQGKTYLAREPSEVTAAGMPAQERGRKPPPTGGEKEPFTATWNISVDTKDFAGMEAEAIKAAMEGLERLAKIVVLKQKSPEGTTEEGEEE